MADSLRKQILANLEETLKEVESLRHVGFGLWMPEDKPRPTGGILPVRERTTLMESDGLYWQRFTVACRVIVDETHQHAGYELEDVLADVETAVLADPTRGGIADDTHLVEDPEVSTNWLYLDQTLPQAGADILFEVKYQRQATDPSINVNDL